MMHGHGKSDSSIIPGKPPNEAEPEAKEAVEGREPAKERDAERAAPQERDPAEH